MNKVTTIEHATNLIQDGAVVMIGGFLGGGIPHQLINALVKKNVKNLTLICNDTGFPDVGVGQMVCNKQFRKIYASHIGTNKETGRQMMEGETEVILVPQGTLAEQIRAGGYGLGGVLTKTGVGTEVEKGKQTINVDGEKYLLEKPLVADIAIIAAKKADKLGNLVYHGSAQNFNSIMASAAKVTIAEVQELVEVGELDPDFIHTPGIFVNYIVTSGGQ